MGGNRFAERELDFEPRWPIKQGPYLVLLETTGRFERRILQGWIERNKPERVARGDVQFAILPRNRRKDRRDIDPRIEAFLQSHTDPLIVPLRVCWLPAKRRGRRSVGWRDLVSLGDPRDPDPIRQFFIYRSHPDRCRVVAGQALRASQVREMWDAPNSRGRSSGLSLALFAAGQAWIELERAERKLRGSRYKVPKFPRESLIESPTFTAGVAELAQEANTSYESMAAKTRRYVKEIAATHRPFVIDLLTGAIKWLIDRAYTELDYSEEELAALYELSQHHPLVFLPSHKSNLDHLVLQYVLYENGLPPNHTAGGINMNFFPVGPFLRRSGVFFIRREFRDNEPYKFVLRRYVDYLLEKRFPMEWYIEGGRSRSGKLRPPRYGMLAYVVDSFLRGSAEDVVLIPVSIAYDQIQDVGSYASEQSGGAKERESFKWFVSSVRGVNQRYGAVHIRFGAPISTKAFLALEDNIPENPDDTHNPAIPKLAFEIAVRLNEVTPITPTSLVALVLLSLDDRPVTSAEIAGLLTPYLDFVARRKLPTSEPLRLDDVVVIEETLAELGRAGVIESSKEGDSPVHKIRSGQHLAAAYYLNTIIHFFVNRGITELALVHLAAVGHDGSLRRATIDDALRIRDMLKFEFFFSASDEFEQEIRDELADHDPAIAEHLDADDPKAILLGFRPSMANPVLRTFFEAYRVVGDIIEQHAFEEHLTSDVVQTEALNLARQYAESGLLTKPAAISKVLFASAVSLAGNRGLFEQSDTLVSDRRKFAQEMRDMLARLDALSIYPQ